MENNREVTRDDVRSFYSAAALAPKKELCCPVTYTPEDISHIPEEVFSISYGCGSPVAIAGIMEGEIMADLGSGGGIDCFIAAKKIGPSGKVIGVDMTEEMLEKAKGFFNTIATNLGYSNVDFRYGFLEDIPIDDNFTDIITSNCVINLSTDKDAVFKEIYRVLKTGGRFVISDIVSDKEAPEEIKRDKELWGECISGSVTQEEFLRLAKDAGFYGIEILKRDFYKEVEGIKFYSVTLRGFKFRKGKRCLYIGHYAVYLGPFSSVHDDDNHEFKRGEMVEVCTDTIFKLSRLPYAGKFLIIDTESGSEATCGPSCC
ncbi:MAG: methyltransferase domain-containing protein [Nitrospirota bacterium]